MRHSFSYFSACHFSSFSTSIFFNVKALKVFVQVAPFLRCRYQDIHNQSFIMVMASGKWLGVRLDLLSSLLTGAVAVAAVLVSQDAGW